MTRDTRQQLQPPHQRYRRVVSFIAGHAAARRGSANVAGLSPDDGYDWLQRIGRTRATRR